MNIRLANKFDQPEILEMLRHFREQTPIEDIKNCDNAEYISSLYHALLVGGGIALVAEINDEIIGMVLGIIEQNIWDPNKYLLRELVYWVEPKARGTTAGYRLLKEYNKFAEELKKQNRIHMYTMTKMVNSPDIDFNRFGYRKIEEVWVAGA
jgi:N-acetylglutamate synthase-like GNAT family acetyltransferase